MSAKKSNSKSLLLTIGKVLGAILYELQPVRPDYAFKCTQEGLKFASKLIWELSRLLIKGLKFILPVIAREFSRSNKINLLVWCLSFYVAYFIEFLTVWIILSLTFLLFTNLGDRKEGELSAYSVFNKGFRNLLGSLTAEEIDNHIRHR